jgi:leucyl aminopeptidase
MIIEHIDQKNIFNIQKKKKCFHHLFLLDDKALQHLPFAKEVDLKFKRSNRKKIDLNKAPFTIEIEGGHFLSLVILNKEINAFQRHTLIRKALQPLIFENPKVLSISVFGDQNLKVTNARAAIYSAHANTQILPNQKKEGCKRYFKSIYLSGLKSIDIFDYEIALVSGNALARQLTILPPNELNPSIYRAKINLLAKSHGWRTEEFDMEKLKKIGAGAFVAVGQGSEPADAAIVHLTYKSRHSKGNISIVGKGVCFDTGGHNLKSARYMYNMHQDMSGSAIALGILLTATLLKLPIQIDCWLAIAQNHIGPTAYKQNDVVKSLNGTSIEIVHTDAEGRMILADTLTLASRLKPDLIIDYATLTGSMVSALGDRYSGVISNKPELSSLAVAAGSEVGERVCAFPFDEDYEEDLLSSIADIKQCSLDNEADHILAARFLSHFVEKNIPWLHVDLSSSNKKGGLGAIASDVTGFGVSLGLQIIKKAILK